MDYYNNYRAKEEQRINDLAETKVAEKRDKELEQNEMNNNIISLLGEAEQRGVQRGASAANEDFARSFGLQASAPMPTNDQLGIGSQASTALAEEIQMEEQDKQASLLAQDLFQKEEQGVPGERLRAELSDPRNAGIAKQVIPKIAELRSQKKQHEMNRLAKAMIMNKLPGSAEERMNSPITKQSKFQLANLDPLIQQLHQRLSGQPMQGEGEQSQQQQGGPQNG